ncbi:putative RecB family nuclease [Microbacterium foliorum]|uniref:RecB family nuclease n=1 Tax=Microbacterium foliorum TaxID=104336 RepID=A0ABU1HKZ8_9MICO|nr:putative RecB family nuclease [Microbacterium foliorum]
MRIDTQAQRVIWSASDLKAAAECEFAWCRAIDAKLGRVPAVEEPEDATLARAALLGDVHEQNVLARYIDDLGSDRVHRVEKVSSIDAEALAAAVEETVHALESDALVVFQAAFATPEFVGFADFLKRDDDGRWRVQDSKLARKARVTALMQLAAYVDQLDRLGIPRSDEVDLILGDGTLSTHSVDDLLPLFQVRRARLRALIADRRVDDGSSGAPAGVGRRPRRPRDRGLRTMRDLRGAGDRAPRPADGRAHAARAARPAAGGRDRDHRRAGRRRYAS